MTANDPIDMGFLSLPTDMQAEAEQVAGASLAGARDPMDLVRRRAHVRVRSGAAGFGEMVMAEGEVVAYSPSPMICVRDVDGNQTWWSVHLPIDVLEEDR